MLNRTKKLIAITFSVLCSITAYAGWIEGAEIYYRYLGGNDYEITLTLLRSCDAISPPNQVSIGFNCSGNTSLNFTTTMPKDPGSVIELTRPCPAIPTRCSSSTYPSQYGGIQAVSYRKVVMLPPCETWRISYTTCCRNPSNSIYQSISQNVYIEAILKNLSSPGSGIVFTNIPNPNVCTNQISTKAFTAYDDDGDSLSYESVTPKTGSTTVVTYNAGYSANNPFGAGQAFQVDQKTGIITFSTANPLATTIAVVAKKWRKINGVYVMIGSFMRDINMYADACTSTIPSLSGADIMLNQGYDSTNTLFKMPVCKGDTVNFNIYGFDPDNPISASDSQGVYTITWNNGIQGGTFTVYNNNTDSAFANFFFIPPPLMDYKQKCFNVTIEDKACPLRTSRTYGYCIIPISHSVNLGSDTLLCKGEGLDIISNADPFSSNIKWTIDGLNIITSNNKDTLHLFTSSLNTGQHYVSIEADAGISTSQCPARDTIIVDVVIQPDITLPEDTILCGKSLILDAGSGTLYNWSTGATTRIIQINPPFSNTVTLAVDGGNSSRCTDVDTIHVQLINDIQDTVKITGPVIAPPNTDVLYSLGLDSAFTKFWKVFGGYILNNPDSDTIRVRWFPLSSGIVMVECDYKSVCYASDTMHVVIGYTGMNRQMSRDISVSPNPASDFITFELNGIEEYNIQLYDLTGKTIYNSDFKASRFKLDLSEVEAGFYLYSITDKNSLSNSRGKIMIIKN